MKLWVCQLLIIVLGVSYLAMRPVATVEAPVTTAPVPAAEAPLPPVAGAQFGPVCTGPYCRNLMYPICTYCGRCGRVWISPRTWTRVPYAAVRQRCWTSCSFIDGPMGYRIHTWTQYSQAGCCTAPM